MALNLNEDTEFSAALRERGIIPQLPPKSPTPPPLSPPPKQKTSDDEDQDDDTDDDDLDELLNQDLPPSVLEKYRQTRMNEIKASELKKRRFGSVYPIAKADYQREVTDASKQKPPHLEDEEEEDNDDDDYEEDDQGNRKPKLKGTGVVCLLWDDGVIESRLMKQYITRLASLYPATKFVSIVGSMCIPNYPDKNIPTLLIYRDGQVVRQTIGMASSQAPGFKGEETSFDAVERLLLDCNAVDQNLKVHG